MTALDNKSIFRASEVSWAAARLARSEPFGLSFVGVYILSIFLVLFVCVGISIKVPVTEISQGTIREVGPTGSVLIAEEKNYSKDSASTITDIQIEKIGTVWKILRSTSITPGGDIEVQFGSPIPVISVGMSTRIYRHGDKSLLSFLFKKSFARGR